MVSTFSEAAAAAAAALAYSEYAGGWYTGFFLMYTLYGGEEEAD